jgi:diguanylate cyclase (GGDEF)-like protein/PAS domain S-box-containing protein
MHASTDSAFMTPSPGASADNGGHPSNQPVISRELTRVAWLLDFSRRAFGLPLTEPLTPLVSQAVRSVCQSEVGAFWQTRQLATDASPAFAAAGQAAPAEWLAQLGTTLLTYAVRNGQQMAWELSGAELADISPACHLARVVAFPCCDSSGQVMALLLAGHTQTGCDAAATHPNDTSNALSLLGQQVTAVLENRKERHLLAREAHNARAAEERQSLVLRGSGIGWWNIQLRDLHAQFSDTWWTLLGREPHAALFDPGSWESLVHPEDLERVTAVLTRALRGTDSQCESHFRVQHSAGHYLYVLARASIVRDARGNPIRFAGTLVDLTDCKKAEDQMRKLAFFDPLTNLPNRRMMLDRLLNSLKQSSRTHRHGALMVLDLDRFKQLNDTRGHDVGDVLLKQVGDRLTASVRECDTVARLGGDEYVVILEHLDADAGKAANDAIAFGNKLLHILGAPYYLEGPDLPFSMGTSMGIALFNGKEAADTLLRQADVALYRAKDAGRHTVRLFDEAAQRQVDARLAMEDGLRRALNSNEFHLDYHPLVDVAGQVIGAEALLRWQTTSGELILPNKFIPIAEETGLINLIGSWVLKEACRQGKQWLDQGFQPIRIAVNLSPQQFLHNDICEIVMQTLAETGFPASYLELELTESALMKREKEAIDILNRLHAFGVHLAIDDFGTGYSSLAYLKAFPLDVLKIDKSFIDDIPKDTDDMEITATIIAMAKNLRMQVIAEGVETAEQMAFLRSRHCDYYQGYYTSKALDAKAFEQFVNRYQASQ